VAATGLGFRVLRVSERSVGVLVRLRVVVTCMEQEASVCIVTSRYRCT
jgi:hypothetical protein